MRAFAVLIIMAASLAAQVTVRQQPSQISVEIGGKPFTALFYGPNATKPYLHPLRTATGKLVTREYPMADVPGESKDHPHHRGLWFSHGNVNGFDLWGNEPAQRTGKQGTIVLKRVVGVHSGEKSGDLQAEFTWLDPAGKPLLTEDRRIVFYADPVNRTMDFDIRLTAVVKVTFGDTKEGTFAIRLATPLEEQHGGRMTNSLGAHTEAECWGKRADWMDYAGQVAGEDVGVAIFDHPGNPAHPTFWHARAYGLFAANPFGAHDFTKGAAPSGAMTIEPGQSLRFRYRVLIHPGNTVPAALDKVYAAYRKDVR